MEQKCCMNHLSAELKHNQWYFIGDYVNKESIVHNSYTTFYTHFCQQDRQFSKKSQVCSV